MEDIVKQYIKPVYNYIYRIIKNKSDTEDIAQETFVKVWKNLGKFEPEKNFKTWIFTIARNTAIDYLRKRKNVLFSEKEEIFQENIVDTKPLSDEIFMKKELAKELEKALAKIRYDFVEIILLHYTENLTFEEISEITRKPTNTVKSQHLRALHQIRRLMRI
jgi:RNA polymerase sigma-70 factor, ECF subfamily